MKVVRWPELDIIESSRKVVDELWTQTEHGPILTGCIFPIEQLENLKTLKARIDAKKKELLDVEAGLRMISREFKKE